MEVEVFVEKFNCLDCKIHCDSGIAYEIWDRFSFFVQGYKFMPKFKSGAWDGKVRLFDIRTRSFPIGLLNLLIGFLKESEYEYEIDPKLSENIPPDEDLIMDIWSKTKFKPRKHQFMAVMKAAQKKNLLILSPTGSGKSLIIYAMVRYFLENMEGDILITVPSTQLVEQLFSDFDDYQTDGWEVDLDVHRMYGGKEKDTKKRVVLSTWQSVFRKSPDWFSRFNAYICDEAHQADGSSISNIIKKLPNCEHRIGLTGTLDGSKMHELEMMSRFGGIYRATTTKELMETGELALLKINCLQLLHTDVPKKKTYQDEIDFIVTNEKRNRMLCDIAMAQEGNVLMLFNFIEKQGSVIYDILSEKCAKFGKTLFYIDGSVGALEREQIRQKLEKNTNCILLASYGTLAVGTNIKNLDVLMFCHPFKAKIRNLQSIGRALRVTDEKTKATLIDFGDDFQYNTKKTNTLFEHFVHRLQMYKDEGFEYAIKRVEL